MGLLASVSSAHTFAKRSCMSSNALNSACTLFRMLRDPYASSTPFVSLAISKAITLAVTLLTEADGDTPDIRWRPTTHRQDATTAADNAALQQ